MGLLYDKPEWDFPTLKRICDAMERIAVDEMGLDCYPNQIEVITAEQMLDAYSSVGLPLMYKHWSFGKHFARDELLYKKGRKGLAYEIVINSSPCISYIMEENTTTMQALVIAHAAYGHNHFFKNNHMFRQWTDAEGILDYLAFAKRFVQDCEEKHGVSAVERILDAAHALQSQGVDRYAKRTKRLGEEEARAKARASYLESTYNPLWSTVPGFATLQAMQGDDKAREAARIRERLGLPEDNLLYFIEKNAPKLKGWERELVRIVRKIGQYFYPQKQVKVMNEGCATWVHMHIMTKLHDRKMISDGNFMEFLESHTAVVNQPAWNHPWFQGWNPYALGYAMMDDIARICSTPTEEDREWFPDIAGNGEPMATLREIWANHRDESFILQYLSPKVMRDFRMFHVSVPKVGDAALVSSIHDAKGYRDVRRKLAQSYDLSLAEPDISVSDVDLLGDRRLVLTHSVLGGKRLSTDDSAKVMDHLKELWGYPVSIVERDMATGAELHRINKE